MKTQKGITLIALIITIIVMLILVGVSVSVALNTGLFKTAQGAAKNTQLAAETETALSNGTINIEGTGKTNIDDYVASLKGEDGEGAQWELTTDADENGEISVGDLLSPTVEGLENEKFYVIADNGTTLTLLAERCINTSTNAQVSGSDYSKLAFDNDSNVYNGSDIQGLVNAYVGTLTGLDLEDVEVAYGGNPVAEVKGRLMWYEETQDTTFKTATNYSDILYGPSTARINYWHGSTGWSSNLARNTVRRKRVHKLQRIQLCYLLWASSSYKNLKIFNQITFGDGVTTNQKGQTSFKK